MSGGLRNGEWELAYPGTVYTFGTTATPAWNLTTPDLGDATLRTSDSDRPRQDGRSFGTDYRGGRTISFEMGLRARSSEEARHEAQEFQRAWRADSIRSTPGAVAQLRTIYDGRERVVYGRPRRMSLNYDDTTVNKYVGIVADFACTDDLFYGTDEQGVGFGIAPSLGGGLLAPLAAPLSTTMTSDRSQGFAVYSEMPVWPVIRINGPILNPEVVIGPEVRISARLDLGRDEWVEIDTRPWRRSALRNGTANVSGAIRGTRLAKASLPSGNYDVGLKGTDPTGTASVQLNWSSTYSAL